jgi:hypothetical protein
MRDRTRDDTTAKRQSKAKFFLQQKMFDSLEPRQTDGAQKRIVKIHRNVVRKRESKSKSARKFEKGSASAAFGDTCHDFIASSAARNDAFVGTKHIIITISSSSSGRERIIPLGHRAQPE